MFRYNQKTGDFSMTPSAIATCITGVFLFGCWMTKMQYDVSGWESVGEKVKRIDKVLLFNHLTVPPEFVGTQWPDAPSPFSPYWPALSLAQGVAMRRELP